jgi:hypothetical protein
MTLTTSCSVISLFLSDSVHSNVYLNERKVKRGLKHRRDPYSPTQVSIFPYFFSFFFPFFPSSSLPFLSLFISFFSVFLLFLLIFFSSFISSFYSFNFSLIYFFFFSILFFFLPFSFIPSFFSFSCRFFISFFLSFFVYFALFIWGTLSTPVTEMRTDWVTQYSSWRVEPGNRFMNPPNRYRQSLHNNDLEILIYLFKFH